MTNNSKFRKIRCDWCNNHIPYINAVRFVSGKSLFTTCSSRCKLHVLKLIKNHGK